MPYLLDTVTISAFRREDRTPSEVLAWSASLDEPCHYLSAISLNELRFGIRSVETKSPDFGEKLQRWYLSIVEESRFYRILPVDRGIAELAALYRADHQTPHYDSLIAATAKIHNLTLATRNTGNFEGLDIEMVNPWQWESTPEDQTLEEG